MMVIVLAYSISPLPATTFASRLSSFSNNGVSINSRMAIPDTVWCTPSLQASTADNPKILDADIKTTLEYVLASIDKNGIAFLREPALFNQFQDTGISVNDCAASTTEVVQFPIFPGGKLYRDEQQAGPDFIIFNTAGTTCNFITRRGLKPTTDKNTGTRKPNYRPCVVDAWNQDPFSAGPNDPKSLMARMGAPGNVWCTPDFNTDVATLPEIPKARIQATLFQALEKMKHAANSLENFPWPRQYKIDYLGVHDCVSSKVKVFWYPIFQDGLYYGDGEEDTSCYSRPRHECEGQKDYIVYNTDGTICNFINSRGAQPDTHGRKRDKPEDWNYQLCLVYDWDQNPFDWNGS